MNSPFLHQVSQLLAQELPFFVLKKSNENRVNLFYQSDQEWHKTTPLEEDYIVFAPFLKEQHSVYIPVENSISFPWTQQKVESTLPEFDKEVNKDEYVILVDKAINNLQQGDLRKVVLSRKQTIKSHLSQVKLLERLLNLYPTANSYFFYHPKVGAWMGATPELLLKIENTTLKTMSLAGTVAYDGVTDIYWGKKEREEQQLVTDYIVEQLKLTDATDIETSQPQTVQAGAICHLKTDIEAQINPNNMYKYLNALHPTPAVCGMPTKQALQFIKENEGYERSFYTGFLGVVNNNNKNAEFFVNLRCMELNDKTATLYVGGGITALSHAQAEYLETVNKMGTMLRVL
ncbi:MULTISPECIES: isochorismate synthase [Nonlabens]|uniref:isochorismate synthase n=1 Tax=Nonlabens TaxID=363408 RepID=UPI000D43B334|nr:isochorismate synthase [Nonlabens tegetincola]PQJ17176.1 hypothetical protein BST93_10990 [Nonlabens tegetincola]